MQWLHITAYVRTYTYKYLMDDGIELRVGEADGHFSVRLINVAQVLREVLLQRRQLGVVYVRHRLHIAGHGERRGGGGGGRVR